MNHSDSELETETKTLDKMYILPTDLAWFFYWSSNGDYAPSEEACSVFIRIYSPNKAINPTPKKLAKPSLDKVTEKRFNKMKTTFRSMKNFHAARSPTKLSSPKRSEHNGDTFEADLQMSYETFVVMLADVHQNRAGKTIACYRLDLNKFESHCRKSKNARRYFSRYDPTPIPLFYILIT